VQHHQNKPMPQIYQYLPQLSVLEASHFLVCLKMLRMLILRVAHCKAGIILSSNKLAFLARQIPCAMIRGSALYLLTARLPHPAIYVGLVRSICVVHLDSFNFIYFFFFKILFIDMQTPVKFSKGEDLCPPLITKPSTLQECLSFLFLQRPQVSSPSLILKNTMRGHRFFVIPICLGLCFGCYFLMMLL
jgi:hypothetical protein